MLRFDPASAWHEGTKSEDHTSRDALVQAFETHTRHDLEHPQRMKQFLEFVPIVVFVIVYYLSDIYYATGALMIAVTLQVGVMRLAGRPVPQQLKVTFWLSLVFGGLTLFYQDKTFIQWKPTILNGLLACALVGSQFVGERNLVQRMLDKQITLPNKAWTHLNAGWALGFTLAGVLNLYVAYNFSEAFWVNYKLIGGFGLTLLYVIATVGYLAATGHLQEPETGPVSVERENTASEEREEGAASQP